MRCLALLAFISNLITSTSVTAHPLIEYSHQESRDFNLSDFYISGSPHSTITSYSFSTTDGKTSAQCYGSTATGPYISSLPNTCCGTTDCRWMFSFQLASNSSGYVLNVTNIPLTSNYGKTKKYIALKYYPSSAVRVGTTRRDVSWIEW